MVKNHLYFAICDNGMGLSRTRWACSMFSLGISGALNGHKVSWNHFSYPYPNGIMNSVSAAFLDSVADDLIMIDTDIDFTDEHMRLLLSHDLPYVGGIVPKRVAGLELAVWPHEPQERLGTDGENPLVDADMGRGFCRINRSVFNDVAHLVPEFEEQKTGLMIKEYFRSKPGGHSEDFAFCEMWRSLGNKAYVDRRIFVGHEGSAVYPIPGTY